jgi:hypothetical protein
VQNNFTDQILHGGCIEVMRQMPANSHAPEERLEDANVFGLYEISSLALMSCARVCRFKSLDCSSETILVTRLETRPCDCSFVLAVPVQTSAGKRHCRSAVKWKLGSASKPQGLSALL